MSHTTVTKLLYELDSVHGIGWIERYRQGNNRPPVIYMKNIVKHKGICFLLIAINSEYYALPAKMLFNFIDKKERKSIPYDFIKENGYKLDYNYLKGIDYIKAVDLMIKENV